MAIFNLFGKKEKSKNKGYYPIQISNIEKLNSKAVSVELDIPTTLKSKFQFEPGQLKGRHTLQPGNYTLVFRARNARGTLYSIKKHFTITSGNTTNLNIHG